MVKVLRKMLSILGPGVITGAADDDPSGIATYSQEPTLGTVSCGLPCSCCHSKQAYKKTVRVSVS